MIKDIIQIIKKINPDAPENISEDLNLIESGVLDSLNMISFLFEIQEKFDITIKIEHLTIENIRTIKNINTLLEKVLNDSEGK